MLVFILFGSIVFSAVIFIFFFVCSQIEKFLQIKGIIDLSEEDYLLFCEHPELIHPKYIEIHPYFFKQHPDLMELFKKHSLPIFLQKNPQISEQELMEYLADCLKD